MQLHMTTVGSGPRQVALIHGFLGSAPVWEDFVAQADLELFTFLIPDLRGHGFSARAGSYGVADFAADLVETLPHDLSAIVGHSLGGRVLLDIVGPLRPRSAIYLDPGFELSLPTSGVPAALFWNIPGLARLFTRLYDRTNPQWGPGNVARAEDSHRRWDRSMILETLRSVAVGRVAPSAPVVPSALVLSDDSPRVVREDEVARLESLGWHVRRMPGVKHDMMLEDALATFRAVEDLL